MFQFFLALLAGMVTIGGPCILPLLPIILGTSAVKRHPLRPLAIVLGFTLSFTAFAIIFAVFGSFLGLSPDGWRYLAAAIIALFGVLLVFPALQTKVFSKLEPIMSRMMPKSAPDQGGLWSGFLLGVSLGAVWTPCAGPVLGSILTLVAAKRDLAQAGALLFAFSLGAGIPMLLIAYGGQAAVTRVRSLSKYSTMVQRLFGVLIILVAIGLVTKLDVTFQTWLLEQAPWLFFANNINL